MNLKSVNVIVVLYCLAVGQGLEQKFLSEPKDITVREGEDVTLLCVVKNKAGILQWTRDDFGLGTDKELTGYSRYMMSGDEVLGEWHLLIRNVTMEDDARYQCQVGATENADPIRSRYATLTVISPPDPPVITAGPKLVLREGKQGMVQCISKGGKPATSLSWRQDGAIISSGVEEKIENLEGSKRTVTVSSLKFVGTRNMSGAMLECQALSDVTDHVMRVKTEVVIEYKPDVKLTADSDDIHEGDSVKMSCQASSSPELVEYQWHLGGKEVLEARGAMELVLQADRKLHNKKVTCLARNKVGQSSADFLLDIKCKMLI